jgi:BlaI family penicillinase repressor
MVELKLGNVESQFADIIWNHEPIPSGELVKICEKELEWKKSTTYTMLKRLCERGIFKNENGIVSSLMTKLSLVPLKVRNLWKTHLRVPCQPF